MAEPSSSFSESPAVVACRGCQAEVSADAMVCARCGAAVLPELPSVDPLAVLVLLSITLATAMMLRVAFGPPVDNGPIGAPVATLVLPSSETGPDIPIWRRVEAWEACRAERERDPQVCARGLVAEQESGTRVRLTGAREGELVGVRVIAGAGVGTSGFVEIRFLDRPV